MSQLGINSRPETITDTRPAVVAGTFYPSDPNSLKSSVSTYLEDANLPRINGTVRAIIAPHAGYIYSGPVAGYSFSALNASNQGDHSLFLMGPAHYVPVSGIAVGRYRTLSTPLGKLPVDTEIVDQLLSDSTIFTEGNDAHTPEHCLEVELPFLQTVNAARFRIVPLLFGQTSAEAVAEALIPYIGDPSSRIIVSSDLSHFHSYAHAKRIDTALLEAIVRKDLPAVAHGEACGRLPILSLMLIADHFGWQAHFLDYRNSGDTAGDRQRVVGYGAIAYTES